MFHKIILLEECFTTFLTSELFCPIVIFFVPGQNVTVGKGGLAYLAGEWSFSRVCSDVVTEFTWFTELLLALLTRQVLFIAMDSFDMFVQPFGYYHLVAN